MKNFFICDFFDFSRKFFKASFAFFVLFFLNFSAFAEDVYYRWTPYTDSAGAETWDGFWSVTYTDGGISKAKFWSYWKESESKWEKTFNNNTGGTADYPGSDSNKPAYTYFTGEHSVTAMLDSSPANELEKLHIGDCYNSQAAGSSVGTEKITINLAGSDLNAKTLVLGSSSASVPSVNFALTGGGTLKVSGEMSFAAASGVSCTYNIEVGTGTVLDVSSIELNDSSATVNFKGDGTLKVGNAIFSAGEININVKNLEISGTAEFSGGSKSSFGGAVTNSGSVKFKDSAEGTFGGTFENAGKAEFSGESKSSFVGAVKNFGTLGFLDKATGTFAQDFTNNKGGAVSFTGTAKGTFSSAFLNAGTVDLENASSQIKFGGSFTNNKDGTVTLPDAAGVGVTFGTGTAAFSNLGTVNSSGLCAVTFANSPVTDDGIWIYTGGTTPGEVILTNISYNILILRGNLEVPGDLTATKIFVETDSLKIHGEISSDSIDVKTEKPIELKGKLTVGSAAFRLSEDTNFKIDKYELVFGTDAKKCAITSVAAKNLSFLGTAGSKINFHSASFGQGTDIIGDFYSEPDVLFNCDVHAKSLTAKKDAEIHAAEINTSEKQEYSGAVTVSGAAKTKFNASAVNFRGTTDIQNETEVSAAGAVAFSGNLTVAAASPLAVSASEATFSGAVTTSAKTGITARSGAVRFEKPIAAGGEFSVKADSTGGSVTFADTVKFSGKTSLSASAGQVRFVSTLETSPGAQVSVGSRSAVFEKTLTLGDGLSVNADLTSGAAEFKEAVNSTSKIEVSAKAARFNSTVSAGDSVSVQNAETAVFASSLSAGTFISVKSGVSTFASSVTAANSISVEGTKATFSGDVKVSAGSASILADTVFSGDCNISVVPGQFSIGDSTSPKNTVVETGKNVKFKDISDGNFYGKFNNSGKVSFENCRNIKIWGDSLNSGDFLCSSISDFEISGTFKNEAGSTLSVSGLSSDSRKFVGDFENAGTAEFSGGSKNTFGGAVTNSGSAKFKDSAEGTFSGAVTNATGGTIVFSGSATGTFNGAVKNSGTLDFSDTAGGTFAQDFTNNTGGTVSFAGTAAGTFDGTFENAGTEEFSGGSKSSFGGAVTNSGSAKFKDSAEGTFSGAVTNATGGTIGFSGSAAGTFSSAFSNSGVVDLKNASSQIKFDGSFTNNKVGTVTLPDDASASVSFGADTFSNLGTVNSSGLCTVVFAKLVMDGGTWIYTGGTPSGKVILTNISYNILILKGNLEVPGNLTAKDISVETNSLKIHGEISSEQVSLNTDNSIELDSDENIDSKEIVLLKDAKFNLKGHKLDFGKDAKKCAITSNAAKNLSFFGTAGSKIDFHSASFGQGTDIIGDFYSEPDVLFNCDVHASEINTSGMQKYSGAVTVSGAAKTEFNASAVNFLGTTDIQNETEISATGAVAFSGNLTVAANSPLSVSASEATFSGDVTVSAGALSVIAEKSFFRSDVNVSGKVYISGTAASVQFDSDFISSGISDFDADVYFSAKRKNDVEIRTEGISVGSENSEKNLYVSAVDDAAASAKNLSWRTPADVSGNFVLLNGNITLSNNLSGKNPDISAGKDIVLLNGDSSSMYNDSVSADFNWRSDAEGIFKYLGRENSNAVFPVAFPDGTQVSSEKFISSLGGLGNDVTLSAGKNFYCNGVNLEGDSGWNLKAGDNESSENFAVVYNSSIKNCSYSSSGNAYFAAAEATDGGGNSENVCFGHPEISLARTIYDDVVEISFKDSISGKSLKIENSNNEIWKTFANSSKFLTYENDGKKISFAGTYIDAECTESTENKGDLEKFYLKAPETWNTDATGGTSGVAQSTDMNGNHRAAIPYLNIVRAVSDDFSGLFDEHKNRIANYDGEKRFVDVEDSCPPVLVAVRTGQELHQELPENQNPYDSHNFLEFQYSEEIFADKSDSSALNVQSSEKFGGMKNLSSESGFVVSGLVQFERGKISLGSESGLSAEKLNSIYRNFAVSTSEGTLPQTHRFRISLAGYQSQSAAENPSGFPYWPGYIDSENTEIPSGKIVQLPFDDANSENSTDSDFNDFIKDAKGNSLLVKSRKNHELQTLSVISDSTKDSFETDWNNSVYGLWDLSAPVFAFYHSLRSNARRIYETCEILGACEASDTVLNRIEFHVFDNSEEFFNDLGAEWYSHFGWGKDKKTLFAEDSYASDIFGGSRPFGNSSGASAKTSGGIRYSTLYNKSSYFKYGIDSDSPAEEFKDSAIKSGASSSLFLSQIRKPREISSNDSLYFSIFLKDGTNLPLKTNFSIKFDEKACVTDLAGNLMKSAVVKSVDLVPPRFNMTSAKISGNKLYIVFNKKISLVPVELENSDGTTESFGIADSLRFIKIPENPHKFDEDEDVVSDLYIEKGIPPQETYSSDTFTGLIFTLNRNVTLEDVKNYYIQCFSPGSGKFVDPFTGISDVKVTSVTDINGIYMANGEAHALSDFAVNAVNPVYAYDDRFLDENFGFSASDAKQSNLSVHDWNKEQQNDGTLLTEHDIFVVTSQDSGISGSAEKLPEKIIMYYDNAPDSDSVSSEYNKNLEENLRVWIPSFVPYGEYSNSSVEKVSPILALSSSTNSRNFFVSGEIDKNIAKFSVDWEILSKNGYSSGNQISFLFGLAESDGSATKICHAPAYDEISGVYKLEKQPLFALRLKNSNDPVSLDLWSFRLKSAVLQRGNVTIFNNVIDVNKGEMSVVRVNMPSEGKLDVIVMTLDGNIIRYLQHGTASAGEHNYSWNGTSKSGKKVARGLYFVRVFGNGIDETRKIMVVKN